jgi:3'(2'), 5'-bisphosphate nucleotidase
VRTPPKEGLSAVVSRSHLNPETERILSKLLIAEKVEAGSSLKFCRVAEGTADIYPRVGRTMEWDTAAGDALLRAAGGLANDLEGNLLKYNKPDFANAGFVAWGKSPL